MICHYSNILCSSQPASKPLANQHRVCLLPNSVPSLAMKASYFDCVHSFQCNVRYSPRYLSVSYAWLSLDTQSATVDVAVLRLYQNYGGKDDFITLPSTQNQLNSQHSNKMDSEQYKPHFQSSQSQTQRSAKFNPDVYQIVALHTYNIMQAALLLALAATIYIYLALTRMLLRQLLASKHVHLILLRSVKNNLP